MTEYLISEASFKYLRRLSHDEDNIPDAMRNMITGIIESATSVAELDTTSPDIFLTWYRALDLAAKIDPGRAMIRDDLVSMATFLLPVLLSPPMIPEPEQRTPFELYMDGKNPCTMTREHSAHTIEIGDGLKWRCAGHHP